MDTLPLKDRISNLKYRRKLNKAKLKVLRDELDKEVTKEASQAIELDQLQEELEKELALTV